MCVYMCVQTMNEHNIGCAVTNLLIKDGALEDMRDMKLAFGAACIGTLHAKTKIWIQIVSCLLLRRQMY